MTSGRVVFEAAHQMGLLPLAWLVSLRAGGRVLARHWWLIALAFGASWGADWLSHLLPSTAVGPAYLTLQGGLVVWALAPKDQAARYGAVLAGTAAFVMLNLDYQTPDVLVHTVAWLGAVAICWPLAPARLRLMLGVAFGLGWLVWLGYVLRPGWAFWLTYQSARAAGIGAFCWAAWKA